MLGLHQSLLGCCRPLSHDHPGRAPAMSSSPAFSPPADGDALSHVRGAGGRAHLFERGSAAARLITIALLAAALVSLLLEVPGLRTVASDVGHVSGGWLILAIAL